MNFLCFATIEISTLALFITKLAGVHNWAWLWVFSPVWGAAVLFIFVIMALIAIHHFTYNE